MSESEPIKVSFLGPWGSYSHQATHKYFNTKSKGKFVQGVWKSSFRSVIEEVQLGRCLYAVVPLENSTAGSIREVQDLLMSSSLSIVGEITYPITHRVLLYNETMPSHPLGELPISLMSKVKKVYAHPQVVMQCSNFIQSRPDMKVVYAESTSGSMKTVRKLKDPTAAALGSREGGEIYGLYPVSLAINNNSFNETRFVVLSLQSLDIPAELPAKSSLVFSTSNQPGSLAQVLLEFQKNNLNLCKLESRPIPGVPWQQMFYVEVLANAASEPFQVCIRNLRSSALLKSLKLLGSYELNPLVSGLEPGEMAKVLQSKL